MSLPATCPTPICRGSGLVIVPLAAVFSRVPPLLAGRVGVAGIQVFGGSVSPAGDHSRTETYERDESPDGDGDYH
jgi:hypothetical protein